MSKNKKDQVYTELKERILTLELSPGTALDEVELCTEYGLSRTPLRDVFQRLAGEGYLSLASNRGASVSSMDLSMMRNFFQSAPMIYAAISRLATELATPAQVVTLKKIQSQFHLALTQDKPADMAVYNHSFHEQLGVMAASPYLAPSLSRLLIDHTRMSQRFYRIEHETARERIKVASDQHDAMIEAIERNAPSATVELTLQHWELSRREIDKYVMPDPLPIDAPLTDTATMTRDFMDATEHLLG